MNEGDSVVARFDRLAPKGDAIASEGLEKPIYASGVVPGEEARVRIRRIRRNYVAVDVEDITAPSADRVQPRCPLFSQCSGCQLQHIAYPRQLELKRELVREVVQAASGLADLPVRPVIGADDPWHYRNHGRFTVQDGRLGFVRRFRRQWFEVPHCYIMEPEINEVLETFAGRLRGASQCNVRVGAHSSRMIQPRLDIDDLPLQSGQTHLYEELGGRRFRVSAASFFQVHRAQANALIEVARRHLQPAHGGVLVDAYAGVGTFAALLAPDFDKVIAIEESGPAIRDAQENLTGVSNVELIEGKAEELLPTLPADVDAVILDPPRSGCRPEALQAVSERRPGTLVYVSCDPSSLGRDLAALTTSGPFSLVEIQPVDMFPHTHHIESIALLRSR